MKEKSVLLLLVFISWLNAETLVKIHDGILNGTRIKGRNGRFFSTFIGIPYGEPPIEKLRFSSPVPAKNWNGIRSANKEANACPQPSKNENVIGNEDCLYLNVYTPKLNFDTSQVNKTFNTTLLPVMVWIHGGGFYTGSSSPSFFGPEYLLEKNIVLVSMNYRLGILGFFTTGDKVAPGNFGLKDQVLALKWVQKNIHAFGGDPNRVTIFGGSAGGMSVNLHALSNATHGLFHQYIIQSGSVLSPGAYRNKSLFERDVSEVAKQFGCPINNSENLVICLRGVHFEKLVNAIELKTFQFPILHWVPTDELESEEAFLTDSPRNLILQNKMKDFPCICGSVLDEGMLLTLPFYANLTPESMSHTLNEYINGISYYYVKTEDTRNHKNMVLDFYFNGSIIADNKDKLLENYTQFLSDSLFLYPKLVLVEKMSKMMKSPVYFYSFGYRGDTNLIFLENNIRKTFGVSHGDEILYLFSQKVSPPVNKSEDMIKLMVDLWTSFATIRKPTSGQLFDYNLWLSYKQNNSFLQIGNISNNFDPIVTLEHDYFIDRMNFWKKHFPIL